MRYTVETVERHNVDTAPPESGDNTVEQYSCALHEVSNALTVVLGWLEVAARTDSIEEVKRAVSVAQEHARRGRNMARRGIGAVTDSAVESRRAAALAEFVATSIAPQAQAKGVRIETQLGQGTDVRLESDAEVLQILTNLLLNAIHFSPPGELITLGVTRSDEGLSFVVRDEGPGIDAEAADDLFVTKTSTRPGGAGIGLPLSRQLARKNGGELRLVRSGRGACFELKWPTAASALVPSVAPPCREALSGKRVLLIEDDLAISSLVALSLEAQGAQVLEISEDSQVDEILRRRPVFDAVLLDLSPVKGRLLEILARLRNLGPQAPIVLMSGEPTGVPSEAQGRFAAWVRKPFDMSQLIGTLADLFSD